MDGSRRWRDCCRLRIIAVTVTLAAAVPSARGEESAVNARLKEPFQRMTLAWAIRGASHQLGHPQCQSLLDEFADASGRPLSAVLNAQGVSPAEYLGHVYFYDARPAACEGSRLAMTTPGSRVIFVCGRRLARIMTRNRRRAEAMIIHEMLHSLGLGENPPSSDYITSRVLASCRKTGKVPSIAKASRNQPAVSTAAVPNVAVAGR